jgi:hypothetical protein
MVGRTAVNEVMFPHEARNSLQLGVEGLVAKGVAKQGRCLARNNCVLHVLALLVLCEHKLKEVHFDGPKSTLGSIKNGLPVACLWLIRDGSVDRGNFLLPS